MATVKVDTNNFQAEVLDAVEPVVVDFWAEWCGPCKMIAPSLEEISTELAGKVKVVKLNVDDNPQASQRFKVLSIPTMLLFQNGEVVKQMVGAMSKQRLEEALAEWVQAPA